MKTKICLNISSDLDEIHVPFDELNQGEYRVELNNDNSNDVVILYLNKRACLSFAKIFSQLAFGKYSDGYHLHMGLSNEEANESGIRIVINEKAQEKIVKQAVLTYDEKKEYKIRIKEKMIKYTSEYEDQDDKGFNGREQRVYYYECESLTKKNTFSSMGYIGKTVSEAKEKIESIYKTKIDWKDY